MARRYAGVVKQIIVFIARSAGHRVVLASFTVNVTRLTYSLVELVFGPEFIRGTQLEAIVILYDQRVVAR